MNVHEIPFTKYSKRGAYHWGNVSYHPFKRNPFVVGRYANALSLLLQGLGAQYSGKRVLEIGCGDGVLSCLIARCGCTVVGIDNSDLAVEFARQSAAKRRLPVDFQVASAYELPFKDSSFDAVVSSDVVEHLRNPAGFLVEMRRILKPAGIAVVSTPIRFTESPIDPLHVTEWYPSEYASLVRTVFPDSKFFYSHPLFWLDLYKSSLIGKFSVVALSYILNPFVGFRSRFRYRALQYSLSTK